MDAELVHINPLEDYSRMVSVLSKVLRICMQLSRVREYGNSSSTRTKTRSIRVVFCSE